MCIIYKNMRHSYDIKASAHGFALLFYKKFSKTPFFARSKPFLLLYIYAYAQFERKKRLPSYSKAETEGIPIYGFLTRISKVTSALGRKGISGSR